MSVINIIIISVLASIVLVLVAFVFFKWVPQRLRTEKYTNKWKELQGYCRDRKTWPRALSEADALLDSALRRRKFKGKSMGERMVSAQRAITNNDAMWFAHNLTKKLLEVPTSRPKESDIKAALLGYRNALKDLGAIQTTSKAQTPDSSEAQE